MRLKCPKKKNKYQKKAETLLILGLLLLSTILFFYRIDKKSMWLDEMAHRDRGRFPIEDIMNNRFISCGQMSHAYYLINRWSEDLLGDPDFSCRMPQAVSAIFTVLFIYLLCRHLLSWDAGVIASLFFMTSSFIVKYAQMNRYYHLAGIGTIASFYFFVAFLDTKKLRYLIGWIIAISFFMRAHNNGLLTFGTFGIITALLCVTTYIAGKSKVFYEIRLKHFFIIAGAATVVLLLWMPYTIRIPKYLLTEGAVENAKEVFDAFWTGKIGLGLEGFLKMFYNRTMLAEYLSISHLYVLLALVAAVVSGILWKKSRILMLFIYAFVPIVIMYHVMNNSKAEVVPKRVLQLYPLMVVVLGCGFAAIPRLAVFFFYQMLPKWMCNKRITIAVGKTLFLSNFIYFLYYFIFPLIGIQLFDTIQYYYTDRNSHKVIAKVLSSFSSSEDIIVWYPHHNNAWIMKRYMPDFLDVKTIETKKPVYESNQRSIDELIEKYPQVWVHRIDLKKAGYLENEYIPFRIARRDTALVRREYKVNDRLRIQDAIRLYTCILESTTYPETAIAEQFRKVLEENGNSKQAETLILSYKKYRFSEDANKLLIKYFTDHNQLNKAAEQSRRFANFVFWMPRFHIQAAEYSQEIDDYYNVIKYAKRALYLPNAQDYLAYELLSHAYENISDDETALEYAEEAHKSVCEYPKTTPGEVKRLNTLYVRLLEKVGGKYSYYIQIKKRAKNGVSLSLISTADTIITLLTTNEEQRVKFEKQIRPGDEFIEKYFEYIKKDKKGSENYVEYLNENVTRRTWPFYVCILKQAFPRERIIDTYIPYNSLQKHGFPKIKKMNAEELEIIGDYYEQSGNYQIVSSYWAYIAEKSPKMRSFVAQKQKEIKKMQDIYINDTKKTNLFSNTVLTYTVKDAQSHTLHYAEKGHGAPSLKWGEGGEVIFTVTVSEEGEYDLVVFYASGGSNPLDIFVNNTLYYENAASAKTGGWKVDKAHNVYVGPVKLKKGENVLTFNRKSGRFSVFFGFSLYKKIPSQMEDVK